MLIYQQNDFYRIVRLKLPKKWNINNITQNSHILLQDNDFEIPYIDIYAVCFSKVLTIRSRNKLHLKPKKC